MMAWLQTASALFVAMIAGEFTKSHIVLLTREWDIAGGMIPAVPRTNYCTPAKRGQWMLRANRQSLPELSVQRLATAKMESTAATKDYPVAPTNQLIMIAWPMIQFWLSTGFLRHRNLMVRRVTPCAPGRKIHPAARRGLTRPTRVWAGRRSPVKSWTANVFSE